MLSRQSIENGLIHVMLRPVVYIGISVKESVKLWNIEIAARQHFPDSEVGDTVLFEL